MEPIVGLFYKSGRRLTAVRAAIGRQRPFVALPACRRGRSRRPWSVERVRGTGKSLEEARGFYAKQMAAASRSADPRLERVFAMVPREAFLPPPPWHVLINDHIVETPGSDPSYLYQNSLIVLDARKGINNGEPFLHAGWIGAVAPQPGEHVVHIGTGMGYYTAILSMLVLDGGSVTAYEIDVWLAAAAARNLEPFDNVTVVNADAVAARLPAADVIYVNAGVVAPPASWLQALKPGGRLVFPWRPARDIGIAMLVTRLAAGFSAQPLSRAWFIPCVGASEDARTIRRPGYRSAWKTRAIVLDGEREPDDSAVAVYHGLWFSSQPPA
jgi:protein-L-isoaspartate(D-aspartate) O-methyltransferase